MLQVDIRAVDTTGVKLATFLSFVAGDVLSSKPLVQDVEHFSAEVDEQQRKSSWRHTEAWDVKTPQNGIGS